MLQTTYTYIHDETVHSICTVYVLSKNFLYQTIFIISSPLTLSSWRISLISFVRKEAKKQNARSEEEVFCHVVVIVVYWESLSVYYETIVCEISIFASPLSWIPRAAKWGKGTKKWRKKKRAEGTLFNNLSSWTCKYSGRRLYSHCIRYMRASPVWYNLKHFEITEKIVFIRLLRLKRQSLCVCNRMKGEKFSPWTKKG